MKIDSNPGAFLMANAPRTEPADGSDLGPIRSRPVTQVSESLMAALEQEASDIDSEEGEYSFPLPERRRQRQPSEDALEVELTGAQELEAYVQAIATMGADSVEEGDLATLASNLLDSPELGFDFPPAEERDPTVRAERGMSRLESFLRVMQSNLEPPAPLEARPSKGRVELPRLSSLYRKNSDLNS